MSGEMQAATAAVAEMHKILAEDPALRTNALMLRDSIKVAVRKAGSAGYAALALAFYEITTEG